MTQTCLIFCIALILSGCQAAQKTSDAYRESVMQGSEDGKKSEFIVEKTSLAEMKSRLSEFSRKCLNRTLLDVSSSRENGMISNKKVETVYRPTLKSRADGVTLYLQRDPVANNSGVVDVFGVMPKDGVFLFLTDVSATDKKGAYRVTAFANQTSIANAIPETAVQDVEKWLRNTGSSCPKMQ